MNEYWCSYLYWVNIVVQYSQLDARPNLHVKDPPDTQKCPLWSGNTSSTFRRSAGILPLIK